MNIKDRLIRLGNQNPDLQEHLKPVLDSLDKVSMPYERELRFVRKLLSEAKEDVSSLHRKVDTYLGSDSDVVRLIGDLEMELEMSSEFARDLDPVRIDANSLDRLETDMGFSLQDARKAHQKLENSKLRSSIVKDMEGVVGDIRKSREFVDEMKKKIRS